MFYFNKIIPEDPIRVKQAVEVFSLVFLLYMYFAQIPIFEHSGKWCW